MNISSIEDIDAAINLYGEEIKIKMESLIKFITDPQPHKSKEFLELLNNIYLESTFENTEIKSENIDKFTLSVTNVLIKVNSFEIWNSILNNLLENIFGSDYINEIDDCLYDSIDNIITIILNYTDYSSKFAEEFCKCDKLLKLFYRIIIEFKESTLLKTISENLEFILVDCVTILYNTLRHDISENLIKMREMKFLDEIKDLQNCENTKIKTTALLFTTFAAGDNGKNLFKGDLQSISYFIENLRNLINNDSDRSGGYSSEELLKGLKKLSINEDNKRLLVDNGILPIIKNILVKEDVQLRVSALSILWSLAFDDKNKILIKNEFSSLLAELKSNLNAKDDITIDSRPTPEQNQSFLKKPFLVKKYSIKNLISSRKYSTNNDLNDVDGNVKAETRCKRSLNGLLWTLSDNIENEKTNKQTLDTVFEKPIEKHIMISYNWSDSVVVMKIYNQLIQENYKIWIDKQNITNTENLMESMAQAVQNSSVVIICLSHKYKNSANCRAEAQYAVSRKISLIPVHVEEKYRPDGWLGICTAGQLYCDFAGRYNFEDAFDMLTKRINRVNIENCGDMIRKTLEIDEIDQVTSKSVKYDTSESYNFGLHDWTDKDVKEWFRKIGIERFVWKEHYTGKELDFIRTMSKVPGELFYQICKTELEIIDLKDMRIFFQNLQLL